MSQINLKSITGITSITTPAGVDNVFTVHSNDTTERFRVDSNGSQVIAGILTVTQDLDVDGHTNLDNTDIVGILTVTSTTQYGGFKLSNNSSVVGELVGLSGSNDTGALALWSGGSKYIQLSAQGNSYITGGNFGIGDNSPPNFTGYTSLSIHGSTGGALVFGDDGVDEWEIYGGDGVLKVYDRANTSERLRITSGGTVNIGGDYNNTTGKLKVTGSIIVDDAGGGTGLSMNGVSGQTCGVVRQRDDMQHAIIFRGSSNADGSTITGGNIMEYREYGDHVFKTGAGNQGERLRITSAGKVLIGHNSPTEIGVGAGYQMPLQVIGGSYDTSGMVAARYYDNNAGPHMSFVKSRNNTLGSQTIVQVNDTLGMVRFFGSDGTDTQNCSAAMRVFCDATPASNKVPGRIVFETTDTLTYPRERMRIDSSGRVVIGGPGSNAQASNTYIGGGALAVLGTPYTPNTYACFAMGRVGANVTANTTITNIRLNGGTLGTGRGAEINAAADANWSDGSSHPTRLTFHTVASSSTSATERLRIDSSGRLQIGSTNNSSAGTRLVVGSGNNVAATALINTQDANINALTLSNWDGSTTTNKVNMHFDCSGIAGFDVGIPAQTPDFKILNTSGGGGYINMKSTGETKIYRSGVMLADINNSVQGHQFISQSNDNEDGFEVYNQHGSTATRYTFACYDNRSGSKGRSFGVRGDGKTIFYGDALPSADTTHDLGSDSYTWDKFYYKNAYPEQSTEYRITSGSYSNGSWHDTAFGRDSMGGLDLNGVYIVTAYADLYTAMGGNYQCNYTWIVGMRNQYTNQTLVNTCPLLSVTGHSTNNFGASGATVGDGIRLGTSRTPASSGGEEQIVWRPAASTGTIDNTAGRTLVFRCQRIGRSSLG